MKERILILVEVLLKRSEINTAYQKMIMSFVKGYIQRVDEAEIKKGIDELQSTIIPYILIGDVQNVEPENTITT